jgi:hypothetical protein
MLVIVSLGVMIPFIAPYLSLNPDNSRVRISANSLQYPLLISHIGFAFVAVVTGFLQFIDRIRINHPKIHGYLGRIYVSSILISGLLSLVLVFFMEEFTKSMAFLTLTILWLFTTWKGYRTAVKKRFDDHRIWMIRSFGITLVAVSGRILVPLLLLSFFTLNGFTVPGGREKMIEEVLKVNIWIGIVLNFIIVEWLILPKLKRQ